MKSAVLLLTGGVIRIDALAQHFECSRRTIFRDLEAIRDDLEMDTSYDRAAGGLRCRNEGGVLSPLFEQARQGVSNFLPFSSSHPPTIIEEAIRNCSSVTVEHIGENGKNRTTLGEALRLSLDQRGWVFELSASGNHETIVVDRISQVVLANDVLTESEKRSDNFTPASHLGAALTTSISSQANITAK